MSHILTDGVISFLTDTLDYLSHCCVPEVMLETHILRTQNGVTYFVMIN